MGEELKDIEWCEHHNAADTCQYCEIAALKARVEEVEADRAQAWRTVEEQANRIEHWFKQAQEWCNIKTVTDERMKQSEEELQNTSRRLEEAVGHLRHWLDDPDHWCDSCDDAETWLKSYESESCGEGE